MHAVAEIKIVQGEKIKIFHDFFAHIWRSKYFIYCIDDLLDLELASVEILRDKI